MQIMSFETLEGPHGEETFTTCEHCGRKIKHVAHTTEGAWGIKCAKTAVAAEIADQVNELHRAEKYQERGALIKKAGFDDWMDFLKHLKASKK